MPLTLGMLPDVLIKPPRSITKAHSLGFEATWSVENCMADMDGKENFDLLFVEVVVVDDDKTALESPKIATISRSFVTKITVAVVPLWSIFGAAPTIEDVILDILLRNCSWTNWNDCVTLSRISFFQESAVLLPLVSYSSNLVVKCSPRYGRRLMSSLYNSDATYLDARLPAV